MKYLLQPNIGKYTWILDKDYIGEIKGTALFNIIIVIIFRQY